MDQYVAHGSLETSPCRAFFLLAGAEPPYHLQPQGEFVGDWPCSAAAAGTAQHHSTGRFVFLPALGLAVALAWGQIYFITIAFCFCPQCSELVCCSCRKSLSSQTNVICLAQEGSLQAYVNPYGIVFDMLTLSKVESGSIELQGISSSEYSWFPGYEWPIPVCVYVKLARIALFPHIRQSSLSCWLSSSLKTRSLGLKCILSQKLTCLFVFFQVYWLIHKWVTTTLFENNAQMYKLYW